MNIFDMRATSPTY